MKAILEFDLPEEARDHAFAVNASHWAWTVSAIDEELRCLVKHGGCSKYKTVEEALDAIRDEIRNIMDRHGLNMGMFD